MPTIQRSAALVHNSVAEISASDSDRIDELKHQTLVLRLSPTMSQDLQGIELTPEEGFLLSRIDGASRPRDIISVSPMAESDTTRALLALLKKNLIRLGGAAEMRTPAERAARPEPEPPASRPSVDDAIVAEVDRLLAFAREHDFTALLGRLRNRCGK